MSVDIAQLLMCGTVDSPLSELQLAPANPPHICQISPTSLPHIYTKSTHIDKFSKRL